MSKPSPAGRVLYAMVACILVAVVLVVGVMAIGFYYFAANQAIPPTVDHIQVGMLLLAALCGLTAVAMLVWFLVLMVKRHRPEPPQP